jgi:peptidoglycan pentaglycine glycine transferase (the first glycine)
MIVLDEIRDKNIWNNFVLHNNGSFLQSWQWGEIQKGDGNDVYRFFLKREDEKIACFSVYIKKTPIGKYGYIPRGPVVGNSDVSKQDWVEILNILNKFMKDKKSIFLLWEPISDIDNNCVSMKVGDNRQPRRTILINLNKPLDELLTVMNETKRYGIRYAEKHGVRIYNAEKNEKNFEIFWSLMQDTSGRKKFSIFSKLHFKNIFDQEISKLFFADYNGSIDAASEVIFFGDMAVYLHAGTSGKNRKLTASYLLIWKIIEESKKAGLKYLDLWGIDEIKWPGVTAFKRSFGGIERSYPMAKLIVYSKFRYLLYSVMQNARRFCNC